MLLLKSKSFWDGVLAALFCAMITASATAFTPEGMRLWKPYQPEQFGGQRRDADGVYGSIDAVYWKVSDAKDIRENVIYQGDIVNRELQGLGYLDPITVSQLSYMDKANGIDTRSLDIDFRLGTRITVGNRRGHWGWLFRGYGISDIGGSLDAVQINWSNIVVPVFEERAATATSGLQSVTSGTSA